MHKVLGIPAGEKIEDHYKSGLTLAKALVKALNGDQKKQQVCWRGRQILEKKVIFSTRHFHP